MTDVGDFWSVFAAAVGVFWYQTTPTKMLTGREAAAIKIMIYIEISIWLNWSAASIPSGELSHLESIWSPWPSRLSPLTGSSMGNNYVMIVALLLLWLQFETSVESLVSLG